MNCPCQSGENFEHCCDRFISHRTPAENAQQLMRSRFTAYVLNKRDYLLQTWHPDYRPTDLELDPAIQWLKLDILDFSTNGDNAIVEFEALLLLDGIVDGLHEKSQFVCEQGRWLYTTGEMMPLTRRPWKPGRNSPCPCGSGQKFKRCCAA